MTQEKKQEYTLKITQANKTQLITIIYEMAIDYMDEALDYISVGKKDCADTSLNHVHACIDELIHSLDLNYELARNLHSIYLFSKKELTAAGASHSMHRIWRVKQNFLQLHDAYKELEKMDASSSLMGNTQTVYAGLTYGKYSLNEDVTALSMNRGLMA
ncbi:MAG: flagellar protein FliS [Butyrivibrio sp.]|nr:flagellar protein FliS [Butyrivibrio sp.]